MYKIIMYFKDVEGTTHKVPMRFDKNLSLMSACNRADLYKKRNPNATFDVVSMDNGDVEYWV